MQNIDYSKKIKKEERRLTPLHPVQETVSQKLKSANKPSALMQLIQNRTQSIPPLYLFVGAALFFTSGLIIGMRIDHQESSFSAGQPEINSFKNVNNSAPQTNSSAPSETESSSGDSDFNAETQAQPQKEEVKSAAKNQNIAVPKNIQFPPKENQVNYIIQLGSFNKEEAVHYAASLIKERQEFQGRIFRGTSTGKLFLGYFYDENEAKNALKRVKKFRNGIFAEASIKNIQF
ncbi:MAG TPA: SPOR domain-containing protein [Leptospiraceae bacterium]|nr:SPOR domain-containing protein [Leptospiraceae bacterium]HMY66800.1 SPOR domain-containing protein [Leptospiraceae bacterium]HNF14945.1 SPOR domain-containing protein [Leptospiraceae bacterium]HNF27246.1 SPOR domain-containing protein [Leptospiraceae bacterium]HNH09530.1 SPOR domain-containing protein [Leptospiraceae bacterium]